MLLHLIKKDILIAKNLVLASILIIIAIPLFFMFAIPFPMGLLPFLYMVVLVEILLLQSISAAEAKSPKAFALLCAAPYTRKALVGAKYVFSILLFTFCYVVHTLLALIIDPSIILDLTSILAVLLFSTIVYGIYMPIEFKYGNAKARFVFTILILVFSLGPMLFTNLPAGIDFSMLVESITSVPDIVKWIALALLSALSFIVSMAISMRIFVNKEL
jgi:ABC-2 type transport system permease protein